MSKDKFGVKADNILSLNSNEKRMTILKIITSFPGIRYRDLLRTSKLNNGTLSHHLTTLEKNYSIKVSRSDNSNITRYYPASISAEETIIRGYLKIKTSNQIIKLLLEKSCTFNEIVSYIDKAPSTTSWNLKRLLDADILKRGKRDDVTIYSLKNPQSIEKLIDTTNNTLLDKSTDNYTSLIEDL
jgi:predicted transcriptional regulator